MLSSSSSSNIITSSYLTEIPIILFYCFPSEDVSLILPMREFISKEIAVYNRFKQLKPLIIPTFSTKAPPKFSINQITESKCSFSYYMFLFNPSIYPSRIMSSIYHLFCIAWKYIQLIIFYDIGISLDFVEGLQFEFPHTVHTLLRSVSKLSIPTSEYRCCLCRRYCIHSMQSNIHTYRTPKTYEVIFTCFLCI